MDANQNHAVAATAAAAAAIMKLQTTMATIMLSMMTKMMKWRGDVLRGTLSMDKCYKAIKKALKDSGNLQTLARCGGGI